MEKLLQCVLEEEQKAATGLLPQEDLEELLCKAQADSEPRTSIFAYPTRPLWRDVADRLQHWMDTGECQITELPKLNLLNEHSYDAEREEMLNSISPMLQQLRSLWDVWSEDEKKYTVKEIIRRLNKRGLLDLLGVRKTLASCDFWPPPRIVLENTFNAKNNEKSALTVGARALAKHCHRDETDSWWGNSTGSEENKNKHAHETLRKILDEAHWINIHKLPPSQLPVIEVRQSNGYGARWTHDGQSFRGFLEPQMEEGHSVGWKH